MKIIAFDSSGMVASVAYVVDGVPVAEYTMNHKKTHSQTLLPMLDRIVQDAEIDLDGIDAIAVAAGPGSFTGLRIGAATVKGLGLALEKPVIPVPTCEGLAYNLSTEYSAMPGENPKSKTGYAPGLVVPIMDARRGQVYTGVYRVSGCAGQNENVSQEEVKDLCVPEVLLDQTACAIEELLDKLAEFGEPVTFLGDGVPVFRQVIRENCKVPFTFAAPQNALQRASSVGALAEAYVNAETVTVASGETSGRVRCLLPVDEFKPIYLRKSQAEREHEAAAKARQAQDLTDVAAMEKEMFSDAWSVEALTDSIRYPYNHILLISTEGEIRPLVSEEDVADSFVVGEEEQKTAGYLIYADPSEEAELHRIAVRPEYQRRGLARKLMAELLRRTGHLTQEQSGSARLSAAAEGDELTSVTKSIFLEVRAGNEAAIALYSTCDFQEIDRRKNYYHDPDEDAVIMKK